ncbi:uncharacterized protein NPIL_627391 [Nephila pilipes]|uniref:Sodium channel protein Nach n=1 Tax=Nephila pilipes TaxID=299642 RepID=A0A8X6N678_NEPPI|nr:uncharacterized protein NPIL_627391 [Nephila pilipes]
MTKERNRAWMNDFTVEDYEWHLKHRHARGWTPSFRFSEDPKWHCGDSKKRKTMVHRFIQTTSLHGIQHVCPRDKTTWIHKIVYRTIFVICFLLLISNVGFLVRESLGRESSIINTINKNMRAGEKEDPEFFPKYPTVTLCRRPPYKTDFNRSYLELVEYVFLALGFPLVSFTPKELSMVVDMARHTNDTQRLDNETQAFKSRLLELEGKFQSLKFGSGFNLTQFIIDHSIGCKEFFVSCIAVMFTLDCCSLFRPVITSVGLCFTMEHLRDISHLSKSLPVERPFIVDLPSPPNLDKGVQEGFNVFLTDPRDIVSFFAEGEGQQVVPGFITTISVHLVKRQRTAMHTAWHGMSVSCPTLPGMAKEHYTRKMCNQMIAASDYKTFCNCTSVILPGPHLERVCEPMDMYRCSFYYSLQNNLSNFAENCREPCVSYSYKSQVSCTGLGIANISRVKILYNSKQFVYLQYRTSTFSSLFSLIGGALGFYLGASIITVVEILTFVFSWLRFRLCPWSLKNKDPRKECLHVTDDLKKTILKFY